MFNKRYIAFVEKEGFLGGVVGFDFIRQELIIADGKNGVFAEKLENVELFEELFELNGVTVYNFDVLLRKDTEERFKIEKYEDGALQLHLLDKDLNIIISGVKFELTDIVVDNLSENLEVVGNIEELKLELKNELNKKKKLEFNIKIVKEFENGVYTYFYACNNKETEEIDLIKVVFVGHQLLKEEDYTRITLSHNVFLDSLDAGTITEVSPQELINFATGISYGAKELKVEEPCCEEECDFNCECHEEEEEVWEEVENKEEDLW